MTPGKISSNIISFYNGYLDLDSLKLTEWADSTAAAHSTESGSPHPLTDHYFEKTLDPSKSMDAPTPLWDNLLETQLGKRSKCSLCGSTASVSRNAILFCGTCAVPADSESEEEEKFTLSICEMIEVLIGRLFYPVGKYDNWQVMPFLMGDANTGKSTVADVIKRMFPPGSVGVITATQEAQFGLESIYQKRLVLIPDIPKKFSKIVNQCDFQSMITGEQVSVARKNKTAVSDRDWTAPLLGAGNHLPDYNDNSGSISRRLVVFIFNALITTLNTTKKRNNHW